MERIYFIEDEERISIITVSWDKLVQALLWNDIVRYYRRNQIYLSIFFTSKRQTLLMVEGERTTIERIKKLLEKYHKGNEQEQQNTEVAWRLILFYFIFC